MIPRIVTLVLLTLSCIYAAPVPESTKVSLISNSSFAVALAAGKSKTVGIFEGNRNVDADVMKDDAATEKQPDFALVENVNSVTSFALDKSIGVGIIKNSVFAGENPFEKRK